MLLKSKFLALALFLFAANAMGLRAQMNTGKAPEQAVVAGVSVAGNDFADTETIIALSGIRPGDKINLAGDNKLQSAIKNLWQRKQFSNIEIIADRISQAGVFLLIKVQEAPRLGKIKVFNNKEVDEFEIIKATGKISGDIISNYDLYLMEQNVKKLYEKEGLQFARVKAVSKKKDTSSYVDVNISVEEGVEFKVRKIAFEGNKDFSEGDLRGALEDTKVKKWWQFWKSGKFEKDKYKEDKEKLLKFFRQKGYVEAEIVRDTVIYDEARKAVTIKLTVNEGRKMYIRDISFQGSTVYTSDALLRRLDFKKGDPYDAEKFNQNITNNPEQTDIASMYMDNGYLQVRVMPEEKKVGADSVDIVVNIFEYDRFKIRKVDIEGNSKTVDKVIRRELYTRPGDYFDKSAIIRSVRALGAMNYFNPESLKPDVKPVENDNTAVDVVYKVEERSTDTFNASVGFAGVYGLTGSIGLSFNNFSIAEPFKGGGGQVFNFNWEFGQMSRLQNFSLGFTEPWLFDTPTTIGFNLFDSRINYYYDLRRTGVGVNIGRRFRWPDDYWRADWSLRYQLNDVGTSTSMYYRPGRNTEITIGQRYSRSSVNDMFFPSTGSKFSLNSDLALGALGIGTVDFFKNELSFEMFNPIAQINGMDRVVLYLGAKMGNIAGLKSDTTISPIELYYMGGNGLSGVGVTPLRGYPDSKVGSENGNRTMLKYTAELRFAVALSPMPIYVYGFAEAGNVWEDMKHSDPFNMKRSAGVGIQMMVMPIGVIGFSYGYGFDKYEGSTGVSGWQFLFHLGNY